MANVWDERYSQPGFYYGDTPNDFLREHASRIPPGEVLCLGEGEGRNALYLAQLGYQVTAVDSSAVGLEKLSKRAEAGGLLIRTVCADLAKYDFGSARWSAVVSIFCHLPPPLRAFVHARAVSALRPGGLVLLEAYTPRQLQLGTGGPKDQSLLYEMRTLASDFAALRREHLAELEREVIEGIGHTGRASVVQLIGARP
ncbi:class I SAM-dependent methyltransferase [Niveibacterium sp. 24ML]|uniref:class I SAM-dependent methyltransferase n=1 Tax=Niveibacterium sp. 24ML TaxID=2985512 RepID=UPI00226ED803|nr:class I SAM-dependent methyltransferase [Niveibacterium sp. 24ML]MCX9157423.1 class I SAM-dependent methyltransferase [Niveibacterium sp. 24ML]